MLEGWRYKWFKDHISCVGCDRHWFALGACGSVFPAGKDMYLWETLKRSSEERLTDEEVEAFVAYGKKYFEPYGEDTVEEFSSFARLNLRNRFGTKLLFYYNRSTCGVYDEYETFADEWGMHDFDNRHGRYPHETKIIPSDSYIDFALYWYGRSFEVGGNIGVYVDNNYFCAGWNTEMTAAYKGENGAIVPTTGIWELRELAKRTFVYLNERGMFPINMNHLSTTQILPINGFYTVQYDWEWHFSEGDVQTRYSKEYIQLVSNGEHAGAWPMIVHDQFKDKDDPWTQRTFYAVCRLHEMLVDRYYWHDQPIIEGDTEENHLFYGLHWPILDMCQQPDIEVYRYWDERAQPIKATSPDLLTIVYSRKGKEAIVIVSSYSGKDEDAVLTIDTATLGFPYGYTVLEMEKNTIVEADDDHLSFSLKKHDFRQFKLIAK